jgi:hypothetical protein
MTIEPLTKHEGPARAARIGVRPRLAPIVDASVVLAALFGIPGCGERDEPPGIAKQDVKFDDVPENVRAVASKAIPGVKLNEAWKNIDREGKLHSYEIRGKNAATGKIREVRVSPSGEILETE